ncbi:MAG TPA: carboxylesterase family protein [Petrimonas sp.]|jgi:para-nitrobenzyl esterase|nr:carboxylesterase family protein [Petrimonas sp.]
MNNTKQLNLGTFVYQSENVDGVEVQSFLGIPYAKAERFGMPIMIDTYKKTPVNSGIGMRFPQNYVPPVLNLFLKNPMMRKEILTQGDKTDENAFVLNIWTNSTEGKKPVLVFIHGGGFTYGSGTTPLYNGKYLASKGIVVVTINYRLCVAGFIPVMIDGKLSVNRGFFDQQYALKWVRKNIGTFGGDANNITLMGQSAGGLSVSIHMMSEESTKYFDKLIVCSAGANECMNLETAEKVASGFLKNNRLSSTDELLALPAKKLIKLKMPLALLATPVIDCVLLKDDARGLMKRGAFSPKPVMLGTTEDELEMVNNKSWYKALGIANNESDFQKQTAEKYGEEGLLLAEELRKTYPNVVDVQFKMMEMFFHVGALRDLKLYSAKAPCYGYRMNFVPNIWNGKRGAYHCAEFPFIFETLHDINMTVTEKNLRQSKIIQSDWLEFIKNGRIPGRETFGENGKITLYENTEATMINFPYRDIIEKIEDSGVFTKILNSFLRGSDENFIA